MNKPTPDITPEMLSDKDREHLRDLMTMANHLTGTMGRPWMYQAIHWGRQLLKLKEENEQ